jgi:glycosyltransferase involved in cell wall biosynthesis
MPKILQVNVCGSSGSTGRIAEHINTLAKSKGWETYFAYGRSMTNSSSQLIKVGCKHGVYEHYAEHRIFDNEGLASRLATLQFVKKIREINPDIIHLHNIHDHWLNYRILFKYLNTIDTPVVWTQHDCWAFTGGCFHFVQRGCYRWRDGGCTNNCPALKHAKMRKVFEKTQHQFKLKQDLFKANKNLTIVPVSQWIEGVIRESFLKDKNIVTIRNGVNLEQFCPVKDNSIRNKYGIGDSCFVLGVSSVWLPYKGWNDFLQLAGMLPQDIKLVLVGLDEQKVEEAARYGIIGIPRTHNVNELAVLYSEALCFCNLTYQDTFPTTNLESLACGTPVITYSTGGSPEAVDCNTGVVVEQGNLGSVVESIILVRKCGKEHYASACRQRAEFLFNKDDRFMDYLKLYDKLLER